jgi:ATP-dependent protease Clp ATPase subunit
MYDLPSKTEVKKCIITKNSILKGERPVVVYADGTEVRTPPATPEKAESA